MSTADSSRPPFWHGTRWPKRPQVFLSPRGSVGALSAHTAGTFKSLAYRFALMRLGFRWFPAPPFGSPFIYFSLHTLSFLLSSHVFPASCPVISFRSFFCAHIRPALGVYAHMYSQARLQVAQLLTMRYGSLFVPVQSVSRSSQPRTHTHTCPVVSPFHVFIFVSFSRAHAQ